MGLMESINTNNENLYYNSYIKILFLYYAIRYIYI